MGRLRALCPRFANRIKTVGSHVFPFNGDGLCVVPDQGDRRAAFNAMLSQYQNHGMRELTDSPAATSAEPSVELPPAGPSVAEPVTSAPLPVHPALAMSMDAPPIADDGPLPGEESQPSAAPVGSADAAEDEPPFVATPDGAVPPPADFAAALQPRQPQTPPQPARKPGEKGSK